MQVRTISRRCFFQRSLALPLIPEAVFNGIRARSDFSSASERDKQMLTLLLQAEEPLIWLFTGDSITHGAKHTHGYRSYPEVFAERIRTELNRRRDIIINSGISGNTTQNVVDDFDWRVGQFRPKIVSMMLGTNDSVKGRLPIEKFEENLGFLLKKVRGAGAIPILHTPNIIIAEKDPSRARLPEYVAVVRKLSSSEKVILVDNFRLWQDTYEEGSVKVYRDWLNDPLHPDGDGHLQIARLMFREIGIFDPKAPTCGGSYFEGFHDQ